VNHDPSRIVLIPAFASLIPAASGCTTIR